MKKYSYSNKPETWRNSGCFYQPKLSESGWVIKAGNKTINCEKTSDVLWELRSWQPMQKTLVSAPYSDNFSIPLNFHELESTLIKYHKNKAKISVAIISLLLLVSSICSILKPSGKLVCLLVILMIMFFMAYWDSFKNLSTPQSLKERTQFFFWIQTSQMSRISFFAWLAFLALIGGIQSLLQNMVGGLENLVRLYGDYFAFVNQGQYWRLVSGPMLHASLPHFLNNAVLLIFIGPITSAVLGFRNCIIIFLFGNLLGSYAQMRLGISYADSFLGISPGIFALFGYQLVSAILDKKLWPTGFSLIPSGVAAISFIFAYITSPHDAAVSHFVGYATGIALPLVYHKARRIKFNNVQNSEKT